jgi:hypothetical protein
MSAINIIITREEGLWLAVGLEHFTSARGETPIQAVRDLEEQLEGQELLDRSVGQEPFALVSPAPEHYWKLFEAAPMRLVWQSPNQLYLHTGELRMTE